jgi:hypothetical protein
VRARVKQQRRHTIEFLSSLMAVLVCLSPLLAIADSTSQTALPLFDFDQAVSTNQPLVLMPSQREQSAANFAFDLGGSESRKLELRLSKPLTLAINNNLNRSPSGVGSVFLDSSLSLQLNDNLDITSSLGAGRTESSFQPLGSIHCQNGVLDKGSFHASDCYFINQANVLKQDQVALGLRYGKGNFSTAFNMFRREAAVGQQGVVNYMTPKIGTDPGAGLMVSDAGSSFLQTLNVGQPLDYMSSETSGLDIEFQVGFAMDSAGDIRLGLQLTHILDASYDAASAFAPGVQNWTIANPFDSAKMNLDWSKGNFSGGIQGYYREQIQFLNNQSLDSSTTFDVHFTWRAPWNANLSVGTSNVLGAGGGDKDKTDTGMHDPFEAVYGRIPYVRYQQDL